MSTMPITCRKWRPVPPRALCLLFAVVFAGWLGAAAQAAEVIHTFNSDMQVAKDGELTVTETLRVRAEGRAIRRGIFRDIPLTFRDAAGKLHDVTFSLLSVERDGKPEPYHTSRSRNSIRIYAGSKDVFIPRGDHVYVFRYITGRQVRWFDGKPELNWNVTGNFWDFPITEATYHLHLPGGARPVRWTAFTGKRGVRGTDWKGDIEALGTLTVMTTRTLAPGEGLTVVAEIPQGVVEPPSTSQLFWWAVRDNRSWIIAGGGFLLILAYYLLAWTAVGRDPKRGIIIPLFHPPNNLSPALANYVYNWGFGRDKWRAFTAAALSLAVRGLVRFDQNSTTLRLKSTGKQMKGGFTALPPGEKAIITWLNGQGGDAKIDSDHGTAVAKVGKSFTENIEAECRDRFFRRNLGYVTGGLVLTGIVVLLTFIFGGLGEQDIGLLMGIAIGGIFFGLFVVPALSAIFSSFGIHSLVRGASSLIMIVVVAILISQTVGKMFPNGLTSVLPVMGTTLTNFPFPFVLVGAFTALNGIFLYLMRAPTALGRPIMDRLAGFRLYLETAEADRLNYQAPEITAERFEELLPYAVALDVEKPWADAFEAALRRAHPGESEPMNNYHPTWTSSGSRWSAGDFGSAVAASVGSVSSALASAVPVSSGSSGFSGGGGGGGSGGGGGGGGGGGW
jgi:uncharacterized membrane protein YgcG